MLPNEQQLLRLKHLEIYVSPTGDDANVGTQEKPLASLARARDAVRQLKAENPGEDITVFLRGGVYRLTEPVVFTLADFGGAGQTITYAAFPGETPILCSDVPITSWKKLESYPDQLPQAVDRDAKIFDIQPPLEMAKCFLEAVRFLCS